MKWKRSQPLLWSASGSFGFLEIVDPKTAGSALQVIPGPAAATQALSKLSSGKYVLYMLGQTRFSLNQKIGPPFLVNFLAFAFHLVIGLLP